MSAAQSKRQTISLDGVWRFVHHSDGVQRTAKVPGPWQAEFADLRQVSGRATYSRTLPRPPVGQDWWLCFGAVNWSAVVRLNGSELVRSDNGWLPFEVRVPDDLWCEQNELVVECLLPDGGQSSDVHFGEIPHGKQSWYGPTGGIWQSVRLESRASAHLAGCAITADMMGHLALDLSLTDAEGLPIVVTIHDPKGVVVATLGGTATGDKLALTAQLGAPALWSPDTPALYVAEVNVGDSDTTHHSFGFRSVSTANGAITLNGQPFYMRGALDQDYWPEGICTPPSTEAIEDQFRKAKQLGLNTLRCHIKVPDPRYYDIADRLGLLIWTEVPNVAILTPDSARRMRETMQGILKRDGNHPSICTWTLINEDWGTRLGDPAHRAWLKAEYDWLKAADPTRLVVDNSPCHGNFHVKTDINDFHWYRSIPERRAEWDALTAEFAAGADWTFTPFGDGVRRGDEPLIVSEFGVWGLPNPADVQIHGVEPWWMETGGTWGDSAAYPHGVETRFATLGLSSVFGSFEAFITQAQGYQFANLKYQIESMRGHPTITGYVITELTDVHWESNGLLDMNRTPRAFHDIFGTVNAETVILATPEHHAVWAGQGIDVPVRVATGGRAFQGGELHWSLDGDEAGKTAVAPVERMAASMPQTLHLDLPDAGANRMVRVGFTVQTQGHTVAENTLDLAVYSTRQTKNLPALRIPDSKLAKWFAGLGYPIADKADLTVVHALNAHDIARLQGGARYLVLADSTEKTGGNLRSDPRGREQPFIPSVDDQPGLPISSESPQPNINLIARHGTMWRGDWIAGFSWIRRDGPFAALPGGPLLDITFERIVPHHVMTGFRPWEYAGAVQSGLVVGWVHKPAALIAHRQVGQGQCLATTFRLTTDAPGHDPVAATLADALVTSVRQIGPYQGD